MSDQNYLSAAFLQPLPPVPGSDFRFSAGPWNVHAGEDTFGPGIRPNIAFEEKLIRFKEIGLAGVQFHDDDAVPNINELNETEIRRAAAAVRKQLDRHGLEAEFVAPRLWMDPRTADGGFTSNSAEDREYALWRGFRSIDIAEELGCDRIVLWLAREGTVCAESKRAVNAVHLLIEAINRLLDYNPNMRILVEPKPNEPVDRSFCGTMGHVMGLSAATADPSRVGGLVETAHAVLAGLDPANEMGFALAMGKLWGVHFNDQNSLRYDQDRAFGAENLRQCFNQVMILKENGYGKNGEFIGLDVKAMRTQKVEHSYQHLINSMNVVRMLEAKVNSYDYAFQAACIADRNYEALEMYVMRHLMDG